MLHDIILKGSVDRSVTVRIIDSVDGTPETGVVFNTAGIDLWYRREGAAVVSLTEATLAALTTAHADGGFLHVSHGVYRLDLPDAAFATGANYVDFGGTVTGMIVIGGRVKLVNVNHEDAVRFGLTALPNAAAEAAGGLYTRGTGAGQVNQPANGQIDANVAAMADNVLTNAKYNQAVGSYHSIGISEQGTAQSATANTMVMRAAAAFADGELNGQTVLITGGTGLGQARIISSQVGDTLTVAVNWTTTPSGTITYKIFATGAGGMDAAGIRSAVGLASANLDSQLSTIDSVVDAILVDTGTTLDGRIPAALVSGRMDASVGAMAANTMTAAAAAADLTTELQAGLATATALATLDAKVVVVDDLLDTEMPALTAAVAALDTKVVTIDDLLDTEMPAVTASLAALTTAVDNVPTNAEMSALLATADDAVLAAIAALNNLSAAGVRTAIGMGSANLDTQLDAIPTNAELTTAVGSVRLSATGVDDILDEIVEGAITLRQSVRLWNSAMGGKANGLGTTSVNYRDLGDTKNRIAATVDSSGNRSAVTRDLT